MTTPGRGKGTKSSTHPSTAPAIEPGLDLHLLLDNASLREFIRGIVAEEVNSALATLSSSTTGGNQITAESRCTQASCARRLAELSECTATMNDLRQNIRALEDERHELQGQLRRAGNELTEARAQRNASPELALLRSDLKLAQDMGLTDLPANDTQALIQTVAVLAQLDSLKRLWGVLKERCEIDKRQVTADERALLQAALSWHNHNWRSQPYRLIDATPASSFNYVDHQRSRHITKGDSVIAVQLPGIADGMGKALCKALVTTR